MTIEILSKKYAVCKLLKLAQIPQSADFFSLTITDREISLVCEQKSVPFGCRAERNFAAMRIAGVLDFSLTGVIAKISGILADKGISIFTVSTYDTDYILVKEQNLHLAKTVLMQNGYLFA